MRLGRGTICMVYGLNCCGAVPRRLLQCNCDSAPVLPHPFHVQRAVLDEGVLTPLLRCMQSHCPPAPLPAATANGSGGRGSGDGTRTTASAAAAVTAATPSLALLRQGAWLLSNLCRPRPEDDRLYVSAGQGGRAGGARPEDDHHYVRVGQGGRAPLLSKRGYCSHFPPPCACTLCLCV